MKDIKRCYICKDRKVARKNESTCSKCLGALAQIRCRARSAIYSSLKYGIKSYIWNHLPYSIDELKKHLENQFESWMSWNNWGVYNSKVWKNDDISTWTWQIDHIIPQYNFIFRSFRDENFIDCWYLENLRPCSSKENASKHVKERKIDET